MSGSGLGDAPYPPGTVHGFVRQPGGRVTIIDLPGQATVQEFLALNDRSQVVIPDLGTGLDPVTR